MSTKSCLLRSAAHNHSPGRAEEGSAFAILRRDDLMQLPEFTRSTTLRRTCWWPAFLRRLPSLCSGSFT